MTRKSTVHSFYWVLFLTAVILISACKPEVKSEPEATKTPMIGYCPTMHPYVDLLLKSQESLIVLQYDSAAQVMQALNSGAVHGALIGRIAWENEIGEGMSLLRIADGYTLIAWGQGMIRYEDLQNIAILTTVDQVDVGNLLPEGTDITYYQDLDQMLQDMDRSIAVLLPWSEVLPSHNLLITVDEQGLKVPVFRSPHFYYYKDSRVDFSSLLEALAGLQ